MPAARALRRSLQTAAVVLSIAFAVRTLAPWVHLAVVPHVPCPTHGGLLHVGQDEHHAAHTSARADARSHATPNPSSLADGTSHAHEDCLLALPLRERGDLPLVQVAVELRVPGATEHIREQVQVSIAGPALHLLAPKHSPPA